MMDTGTRGEPHAAGLAGLLDRPSMQTRVRDEILRSRRYVHQFGLIVCEEVPSSSGMPLRWRLAAAAKAIHRTVRSTDAVGRVFDDVLAVLLVETPAAGVDDALFRIRQRVTTDAGPWRIEAYRFPADEAAIQALAFMRAI